MLFIDGLLEIRVVCAMGRGDTELLEVGGLVSCPARARLPARNGLVNEVEFLGLITQNG